MSVKVKAYAKINLMLDIISTRKDGYHDLFMIMQSINLYDTVTISETKSKKITITCNIDDIPLDEKNIAYKAADAFFKANKIKNAENGRPAAAHTNAQCAIISHNLFNVNLIGHFNKLLKNIFHFCANKIKNKGINIDIVKRIPHQAGLAGGSADGAAVLVALNELLGTNLSDDELCNIGVKIGADVPFCIKGGTLLAQGIGDVLHKVKPLRKCFILIEKPDYGVNTGKAYALFDSNGKIHTPDKFGMLCAMQNGTSAPILTPILQKIGRAHV